MTQGPRHRTSSWLILATLLAAVAILIGFGIYGVAREPAAVRGAAGSLTGDTPGSPSTPPSTGP